MKHILILSLLIASFSQTFGQDLLTKQAPLPCLNKNFNISVHIVKQDSSDVIPEFDLTALSTNIIALNEYFAPICVQFEVCKIDTVENYLYNSLSEEDWEEMQIQYNEDRRINMYFVTSTDLDGACGFATLGGINESETGGIVILKGDCMAPGSITIPHEMGHYFNLQHTFNGNGAELVNGANCETEGDQVCDTPADPYTNPNDLGQYIDADCIFISTLQDANGEYYKPDVGNIMSYYIPCACGFTHGQYLRMAKAASTSETW